MEKSSWNDLPERVREQVATRVGEVVAVGQTPCGSGSDLAAVLHVAGGRVFVKGIRTGGVNADVRRIEQKVQAYLPDLAPRFIGHMETDGWLLLIFEYVAGRHARLAPGSTDLPLVAGVLDQLSRTLRPRLPVLPIEKRWAAFADGTSLTPLRGTTLVHMDLTAENIVIGDRVRVLDWAWPTLGAAWLDTASMVARLIQAGHTPGEAEAWARQVPAWTTVSDEAVAAFLVTRMNMAQTRKHESLLAALSMWKEHHKQNH